MLRNTLKILRSQIAWKDLTFGFVSLLPVFLLSYVAHDLIILKVGLITVSLFIAAIRLNPNALFITLHFCSILLALIVLYYLLAYLPVLFVIVIALFAFVCIFIGKFGTNLRSVGNFTFIPALYLACELHFMSLQNHQPRLFWHFFEFTPAAWFSMLLICPVIKRHYSVNPIKVAGNTKQILSNINFGEPLLSWFEPAIAVFFAVFVAALLAIKLEIPSPEWLLWSTASVIGAELGLAHKKFIQRFLGAILGVTVGFIIGSLIAKTQLNYSLAVLGVMLTLITFKNYFVGFSSRCFFITVAICIISTSHWQTLVRIQNVFIGGALGMLSLYLVHYFFNKFIRKKLIA